MIPTVCLSLADTTGGAIRLMANPSSRKSFSDAMALTTSSAVASNGQRVRKISTVVTPTQLQFQPPQRKHRSFSGLSYLSAANDRLPFRKISPNALFAHTETPDLTEEVRRKHSISRPNAQGADSNQKAVTPPGNNQPVELAFLSYEHKHHGDTDRTPLIVHHSLVGNKDNFKNYCKEFNHVTRRKVISLDARNHGDSPHVHEMSHELMAMDVKHLMKQQKLEKVSFMGHNMGGHVGMILALTEPALIDRLVIVDTSPVANEAIRARWTSIQQACRVLKEYEATLKQITGFQRRSIAYTIIGKALPDSRDRALLLSNLHTTEEGPLWKINIESIITHPELSEIRPFPEGAVFEGKTLFITGEHSKNLTKSDEPAILRRFPNAEFRYIENSDHWFHVEKHSEFMEIVVPFLQV